jgi:hypothetical protein
MPTLHRRGIRSTKELEEVIEGYSFADEQFFEELNFNIIKFIGFSSQSKPIKIAARINEFGVLETLDARIPSVEEIINDFCSFCK